MKIYATYNHKEHYWTIHREETVVENNATVILTDMADTLDGVHIDSLVGGMNLLYGEISFVIVVGNAVHIYLELSLVNLLLKDVGVATPYAPIEGAEEDWRGWSKLPTLQSHILVAVIFAAYQKMRNQTP
jgi:hypothetical protein